MAFILGLTISGCGKNAGDKEIDLNALKEEMMAADSTMPHMENVDSDSENAEKLFTNISSIEYVKVDKYFYMYSSTGSAHELACIKLKSEGDVKDAVKTIEEYVAKRVSIFKTYAPTETETAQNTMILTYDTFVVMIMSPEAESIKDVCDELLK